MITLLVAVAALAQQPPQFATVNGMKLHYVDWGGSGDAVLFLTSLGGTADDFQPLTTALTDRYRVLGLTRRGQGLSQKSAFVACSETFERSAIITAHTKLLTMYDASATRTGSTPNTMRLASEARSISSILACVHIHEVARVEFPCSGNLHEFEAGIAAS